MLLDLYKKDLKKALEQRNQKEALFQARGGRGAQIHAKGTALEQGGLLSGEGI